MKLQISFDTPDLNKSLDIAQQVIEYVDILEIGSPLIAAHGIKALETFRDAFPEKKLLVDAKIIDHEKELVPLFAHAGADWISVMAGSPKQAVHQACSIASDLHKKIILDLLDTPSPGHIALEAKNIGAHALLFHQPYAQQESLVFLDLWEMVRSNTTLPIFVSAHITRKNIDEIIAIKPETIVIGHSITQAQNPAQEAAFFYEHIQKY